MAVARRPGGRTGALDDVLATYGSDPIAASLTQPGLRVLRRPGGVLAYRTAGRHVVTLGGAFGNPATQRALWTTLGSLGRTVIGSYLSLDDAETVHAIDPALHVVPFGVEYVVSPAATVIPRAAASAARKATRKGLRLDEVQTFAPLERELAAINARFIRRSEIGAELEFLNRPALVDAPARRFVIRRRDALLGFVELDRAPARPHHYLLNIIRFDPCNVWGVYHWVVAELVDRLASIPDAQLSLGFSPLSPRALAIGTTHAPWIVRQQVELLMRRRQAFYGLASVEDMKALWPHTLVPRHLAFHTRNVIAAGNAVCLAMGLDWQRVAFHRLTARWRSDG